MKNLKRFTSIAMASLVMVSSSVGFAAPRDVYNADGNLYKTAGQMATQPKKFGGPVAVSPNKYLFEGIGGKLYKFVDADASFKKAGASFLETLANDYEAEVVEALRVESVSAINNDGVEVTFEATTEDNEEANVVVKDGEGNVVATEAMLVAEGATSATFDFVTPFAADYDFTGVWTVNGVEYSFDAINQLADIAAAVANKNEIELQAALDAAGITYVDELKIGAYLAALDADALETLETVQEAINEVDKGAADVEVDAAKVKAVADAKTQAQLLTALTANFDDVNSAWIVDYATHETNGLLGKTVEQLDSVDAIQEKIYAVNQGAIDADAPTTAAEQAKHTALIEAWMEPDAEKVTAKAEKIEASKLAEAAYKVNEATTANRLYDALVAFANLADDDTVIDIENIKSENKTYYFNIVKPAEGKYEIPESGITAAPADIVEQGNTAAEGAQTAIDGRINKEVIKYTLANDSDYKGRGARLLGYSIKFDLSEGNTIADTSSIVIELLDDNDKVLGYQSLNAKGYENLTKEPAKAQSGTIDIYGEYQATSWDHAWNADITDFPTQVVVRMTFKADGAVAEVTKSIEITDTDKGIIKGIVANDMVEEIAKSSDVAEVEGLLVKLANFGYIESFLATPKADRTFVAETILEEAAATKEAWTADTLNTYIGTLNTDTIEAAKTAVNTLTNASKEDDVITALKKVKVFEDLSAIAKKDVANAFIAEVLEVLEETTDTPNFKSYTELSSFVEGLM